jgi:hypothetical protein
MLLQARPQCTGNLLQTILKIELFRKWAGLKLFLEDNGGLIAIVMLASMRKREAELIGNPIVLAAVYLDIFIKNRLTSR